MPLSGPLRTALGALAAVLLSTVLTAGDVSSSATPATTAPPATPATTAGTARTAASPHEPVTAWTGGAVDALMDRYDPDDGLWRATGWWGSANALTALIDYMSATG